MDTVGKKYKKDKRMRKNIKKIKICSVTIDVKQKNIEKK